ncbi:MAG TPA: carboxypeptidase-like regulatory domain-containing protein [Gemmatimonadaceae bacterium]|nr:carboxypeptidase-like regulatory domain-containing protein [Gemmatimonadaceae bacterium]
MYESRFHATSVAALLLCLSLGARHGEAQVIRGTVRDVVSHLPVAGATVSVLDDRDSTIKVTISGESGQFSIAIPRPGVYALDARRVGYTELTTTAAPLAVGDTVTLELQMAAAAPVMLDTVRSKARDSVTGFLTHVTPGHLVVAQHYKLGKGIIVSGYQLERSGLTLTEYLGHEPGVMLSGIAQSGTPLIPGDKHQFLVSDLKTHCVFARIDHWSVVRLLIQDYAAEVDELLKVHDIMAVEFYHNISEVPKEWMGDAAGWEELYQRSYGLAFGYAQQCGDWYTIGSTEHLDAVVLGRDAASGCPVSRGQAQAGYAAHLVDTAVPVCGFMQIWTRASW